MEGRVLLELAREKKIKNKIKREVVYRYEDHNEQTPWVSNVLSKGNFNFGIPRNKLLPLLQWYKGCNLFDRANTASLGMFAGNANVTAMAGDDAYTGTNLRRGSFDSNESGEITNGYRLVWNWMTSQGNGSISSIGLTRAQFGKVDFRSAAIPDDIPINERLFNTGCSEDMYNMIIDYDNEVGYKVSYSNGEITVTEYLLNTKIYHITGAAFAPRKSTTHTISQTVANWDARTASICFTGSHLHILTSSGGTLNDYAIAVADWSVVVTTKTFSDVTFSSFNDYDLRKDAMMMVGNSVYAIANNYSKIVKCNMSTGLVEDSWDNPIYTVLGSTSSVYNASGIILPNGDWYKASASDGDGTDYGLWFHNETPYLVRGLKAASGTYQSNSNMNANPYGTQIGFNRWSGTREINIFAMFGYISTCFNLEQAVTKRADLTMKLQYDLVESNS